MDCMASNKKKFKTGTLLRTLSEFHYASLDPELHYDLVKVLERLEESQSGSTNQILGKRTQHEDWGHDKD